ncbi:MAG: LysM peptidoglycan-binding domain-containing protein [Bacteroidales bacterium]|jgi:LysM repeat protein|nr:LysM peptidoglycan-binding domain-containing protein [Bacteroidales bacterium]
MSLTRFLPVIALMVTLAVPTVASAQVPVQVSQEKVVSGGKVYYMHQVQKNQTLYSISRAYRVSIDLITSENSIPVNGIQTGQVLRIPASDQQASVTQQPVQTVRQTTPPAQARPAQQASGSSRVTAATQPVEVNGIRISGEKIVSGGRTFYMHEVQKGQTLYSIAKAYKVTILDIDRENVIPAGGLQSGQMLKIPASMAMTVIEEKYSATGTVPSDRPAADGNATGNQPSGAATTMPRQESPRQATQMPRQETPAQTTQMPRQEQPATQPATGQQAVVEYVADKPAEAKEATETKVQPETRTQTDTGTQTGVQQQAPSAPKSEVKPKPAVEKKKIHKVQKGESLADIAKKYDITVQELKQANKGVIFAMPDMRLVIPAKEEE